MFGQENMKIPALAERERDRQTVNLYAVAATIVVMTVNTILPCWGPE